MFRIQHLSHYICPPLRIFYLSNKPISPNINYEMLNQMAEREVSNLQRDMGELENVRKQLTDFFCEDINSFKLEECFRIFHGFYCKFKQATAENARRRIQEEQANARRKQREELLATKRRQSKLIINNFVS